MGIKGFKVFNPDWTCRDFQYKVGETFTHNGNIEMCGSGFHFCKKASDCFNYYSFDSNNKVAEVEAVGLVETNGNKSVTDKITIIREIAWQELLTIVNEGKDCTGLCNTGNWNTGFFSTITPLCDLFEKPTNLSHNEIQNLAGLQVLRWNFENHWWIYSKNMTNEEKENNPTHKTTGGYLKTVDFKTACNMMWDNLDKDEKQSVLNLPNFNADIFEKITGIRV